MTVALPKAMKDRDRSTVSALRTALSAVANAEAVDASEAKPGLGVFATELERRSLTEAEVESIVREVRDEMADAADDMRRLGQPQRAAELTDQAEALNGFLGD